MNLVPLFAALFLTVAACSSSDTTTVAPARVADAAPDVELDAPVYPCGAKPPDGGCLCAADCPQKPPCHGYDVCRDDGTCGGDPTPAQCIDAGL